MVKRSNERGSTREPYGPLLITELTEREKVCLTCKLPECKPYSAACPYRRWRQSVLLRRGAAASAPEATDAT